MNYDRFNLFESYTNQTLPDSERQALEEQLRTDANLKAELTDYQQFRHSIEAVKLNEQLERIHNRLDRQGVLNPTDRPPQPLKPTLLFRRLRLAGAVLTILLLIGGIYWFTRPSLAEQTFITYYKPEPVSRGQASCSPELMPGIQNYRAGQYADALLKFQQFPASQPCVTYYVGLNQLALEQTDLAIRSFESTLNTNVSPPVLIRQKAEWYLALAYLKANQQTDAQRQLLRITQQLDQPFRNVAQNALADLQHD